MTKDLIRKYIWILDVLYRTGGITLAELNRRWERSVFNEDKKPMNRRTFINCKEAIQTNFFITIECDLSDGYKYYIKEPADLRDDTLRRWMLDGFSITNMIQESMQLRDRILWEEVPSNSQYLIPIIEAMQSGLCLRLHYQTFNQKEPFEVCVEPYCVKAFRQRWYLLARDMTHDQLKVYALDRMSSVEDTDTTFKLPETFDARLYFEDYFGVVVQPEETDVETVSLKVWAERNERQYISTLPLHPSQKEVERTSDYSIFTYRLHPSVDFFQELLKHGDLVEVLSPQWVREEMIAYVREMAKKYGYSLK